MKILVVSATYPPTKSGGADMAMALCQHLARSGHAVAVVTTRVPGVAADPLIRLYPVMERWGWKEQGRLLEIAREVRPDVINLHFHGEIYNDHPMITLAPSVLKRALPGARFVTHIEWPVPIRRLATGPWTQAVRAGVALYAGARGAPYGYGTILSASDRVIILSETHRALLARYDAGAAERCVLIPPPSIPRFHAEPEGEARRRGREALRVPADAFLLAYFGYLYPNKGVETLLRAFAAVAARRPAARLAVVGGVNEPVLKTAGRPRYAQELHELARDLGVADRAVWTGYVPGDTDDLSRYLRAADAAVLPYDSGAFLNNSSLAAAVSHGLPTVTTRGEILEAPLVGGANVLLCPPKDPQAVADAVESLMDSAALRDRLREGALTLAREWFSWERVLGRTLEAFGAPADDGGPPA
jgi:glycosyltransferase involved in cell wall biosynthesis